MAPPSTHAQKRFTPTRPLLNQPPLNIENLPTRIQRGECNVLPPKFCPPICPPTACQPCTPCQPSSCSPYCMPSSGCYYPCTPVPPPMCCPPPCPPVIVCPPPCTPYPCTPCMPSPPPPPCCPPPPCPPPPCQPCVPTSACCGGGRSSCCCSGPKQIICIPKRGQAMMGGCGSNPVGKVGMTEKIQSSGEKPGMMDQPASYNNCNFYLSEIPKSLRNQFNLNNAGCGEEEIMGNAKDECVEEAEEDCVSAEDECDEDDRNIAAGDDQIVHPPVGYPGSTRSPWGAGDFPGLSNKRLSGDGDPYGINGPGMPGTGGNVRSTREGHGSPRNSADRGSGGSNGSYGRGSRNGTGGRGGGGSRYPDNKSGYTTASRNPNSTGGAGGHPYKGNNYGRNPGRYGSGTANEYDDEYPYSRGKHGQSNNPHSNNSTAKGIRNKRSHRNGPSTNNGKGHNTGVASRSFSRASGYRPYSYSNAELTQKSEAYLPENYDIPPPHEFDPSIHPSRAPITPYATYNPDEDHRHKQDFGHMTSRTNTRSQATMKPSCSSVRLTRHANTSTHGHNPSLRSTGVQSAKETRPATRATGVPSSGNTAIPSTRTTGISANTRSGPGAPSNKATGGPSTRAIGVSSNKVNGAPSTKAAGVPSSQPIYNAVGVASSPSLAKTNTSDMTRAYSEPDLRRFSEDEEGNLVPSFRSTTQTSLQIIDKPNTPSEIRVVKKPVQQAVTHNETKTSNRHPYNQNSGVSTVNAVTEVQSQEKLKRESTDPCHQPKTCMKYHTRRLHRLCSFSNQRERRLSDIHKPQFHFKKPPCPIRETVASILRKTPANNCRWHEQKVPAFHEYCMTDHCADNNRYPLLTRELSPLCHEEEEGQYDGQSHQQNLEARGVKRRQHHR